MADFFKFSNFRPILRVLYNFPSEIAIVFIIIIDKNL